MSSLPESTGTTALTNALKRVFYIHKDVVAELKAKLDTALHENAKLKQELSQVSPRRAEKCESCVHLRELNKTLQENFNGRLKDKNVIIKHLERRLRSRGATQDGTCTGDTPPIALEEKAFEDGEASSVPTFNSEECPESQTFGGHRDVDGGNAKEDSCGGRHNKRLRLFRDGHKRSRYVEEAPDCKRRKTSPSNVNESHHLSSDAFKSKSVKERPIPSKADSPSDKNLTKTKCAASDHTILAADTVHSLPTEKLEDLPSDNLKWTVNKSEARKQDNDSDDATSKNLVIPETLGLFGDLECSHSDIDVESDGDSTVVHRDEKSQLQREKSLAKVERNLSPARRKDEEKSTTINPAQRTSPNLSKSRTETTPLSPGIFDDVHRKVSQNETPRSALSTVDGGIEMRTAMFNDMGSAKQTNDDDVFNLYSISRENQRALRQTTLSQSFDNKQSPHSKGRPAGMMKVHGDFDNKDLQRAIKASLEESFVSKKNNGKKSDREITGKHQEHLFFKVPSSPEESKSLKSPRRKRLKEKENESRLSAEKCSGALSPKQGTRTSPRLAKLAKMHSDPLPPSHHREHARKTLFSDTSSSPYKACSKDQITKKPLNPKASKEKQTDIAVGKKSENRMRPSTTGNDLEEANSKDRVDETDGGRVGRGRKSSRCSSNTSIRNDDGRVEEQDSVILQHKGTEETQSGGLNGSLNPDIRLSMYLESQMTCGDNKKQWTDLDETVASSLIPNPKSGASSQSLNLAALKHKDSSTVVPDDTDVSDDDGDVDETIAPSPQQNSILSFQSQTDSMSMPPASIPCSSRSFKFASKPRGKITPDAVRKTLRSSKQTSLNGETISNTRKFRDKGNATDESKGREPSEGNHQRCDELINDNFDVLPQKPAEFPHVAVVRKKSEKDKLQGFSCKLCYEYYKDLNLSEAELKYRMQVCSRHKEKYQAPATPQHFWSMSIPDTAEVAAEEKQEEEEVAGMALLKGPRRRRKLEKRFKSRSEEEKAAEDGL